MQSLPSMVDTTICCEIPGKNNSEDITQNIDWSDDQFSAQILDCSPDGWLKCCLTSTETVGLLGTGAQDGHLDFHTAPDLFSSQSAVQYLWKQEVILPSQFLC